MPRISAAALGVVPVAKLDFPPPAHLNDAEKMVFRDVVAGSDPRYFRHEDQNCWRSMPATRLPPAS